MNWFIEPEKAWVFAKQNQDRMKKEYIAIAISDDESCVICMTAEEDETGVRVCGFENEKMVSENVVYSSEELEIEVNQLVADLCMDIKTVDSADLMIQLEKLCQALGIEELMDDQFFIDDFQDLLLKNQIDIL